VFSSRNSFLLTEYTFSEAQERAAKGVVEFVVKPTEQKKTGGKHKNICELM
jgi:hypothetical protein